ncbi:MAG: hypothetical protein GX942_01915 [Papillibacter sp.]|nr:hypothetical protein [Papillibacter sp.]
MKNENLRDSLSQLLNERRGDIAQALVDKAAGGDLKAFGTIREIVGEAAETVGSLPEDLSALTLTQLRALIEYYEKLLQIEA